MPLVRIPNEGIHMPGNNRSRWSADIVRGKGVVSARTENLAAWGDAQQYGVPRDGSTVETT